MALDTSLDSASLIKSAGNVNAPTTSYYTCSDAAINLSSNVPESSTASSSTPPKSSSAISNAAVKLTSSPLLMTCKVMVTSPDGITIEARALLDNASSTSFVTERLVQALHLPRSHQRIQIVGNAGVSPSTPPIQSFASLSITPIYGKGSSINVSAVVVPAVTCDLPVCPVPGELSWTHISDIRLADPAFGQPDRIDILLRVNVFVHVLRHGRQIGLIG